ncbi:hypothetical protein VIM7927_01385 [Vibrio mangrovi]|nr:hypothetical protein VIM7927_01385 [Vibrio mangrovi]
MFEIDHLMIEVDNPADVANQVAERLGLPLAWPLVEKDEYISVGVNFGDINLEFINFKVRFGIQGTAFEGFSGIAFKVDDSLEQSIEKLNISELKHRIGETTPAYTTIPIEEDLIFPTFFLVKYHFETSGWTNRLKKEFSDYRGGKFHIGPFKSLSINYDIPDHLANQFPIYSGNKNQLIFESRTGKSTVISDLIDHLEIVIS